MGSALVRFGDRLLRSMTRDIGQQSTRDRKKTGLVLGASPRASQALYFAAQATASLVGRNFVLPDDVKALCPPVLAHRIILHPESRLRGMTPSDAVRSIVESTPAPVRSGG